MVLDPSDEMAESQYEEKEQSLYGSLRFLVTDPETPAPVRERARALLGPEGKRLGIRSTIRP
jgi:hypothetical protein